VDAVAPRLSVTVANSPGSQPPPTLSGNSSGLHSGVAADSLRTVAVHMAAPVTLSAITLAIVLALGGALIAGAFGSWRASRLQPAAAMAAVE